MLNGLQRTRAAILLCSYKGRLQKKNPEKVWSFAIDGIIGIDISPSFASLLNWSNDGNDALFQSDKIEW